MFYKIIQIVNYSVIFAFIALFFNNYRKISTEDNVKKLMRNIIKTRNTVKAYIWFNLLLFGLCFIVITYYSLISIASEEPTNVLLFIVGISILMFGVILLLIIGFYRLLYGFLTRRLYKNYEILKKIDEDV